MDELRSIRDNTKGVLAQLETRLRQETGIPKLKIGYNHVFGYFIEVSNSYKAQVPESYIRKQTLTTGERYITQELKELENKILGAHERLIALEHRLFNELLESLVPSSTASSVRPTPWQSWTCWPLWLRWQQKTTTAAPLWMRATS